jgi:hypothetical protein
MTKVVSIILFVFTAYLIRAALHFEDKEAASYLTKIKLFGAAILILILAIGFLTSDKPFCELVPFFCK